METETLEQKNFPVALSLGVRTQPQILKAERKGRSYKTENGSGSFSGLLIPIFQLQSFHCEAGCQPGACVQGSVLGDVGPKTSWAGSITAALGP